MALSLLRMLQELFRIPGLDLPVYGYGLMLVLGVYAAIELGRYLAGRVGLNGDYFVTAGLIALAAGVFGARLSHVLENFGEYTRGDRSAWENFRAAINLSSGGLTFYGGFLFGFPLLLLYGWWRKLPLRLSMDIVAPCLMIGLAFGRVGCLLNGCCWGQPADSDRIAWAVTFPYDSPPYQDHFYSGQLKAPPLLTRRIVVDEDGQEVMHTVLLSREDVARDPGLIAAARHSRSLHVHPTQIYSTLNALLIAGISLAFFTMRRSVGQGFALMLILYSIGRFCLEMLRVEPRVALLGMDPNFSFSMWVAILTLIGGIGMWIWCAIDYCPAPGVADEKPATASPAPAT